MRQKHFITNKSDYNLKFVKTIQHETEMLTDKHKNAVRSVIGQINSINDL